MRRQRGALLAGAVQNSPSPPPTHRVRRGDGSGGTPDRAEDVVRVAGVDVGADGEEEDEEDDDGRYHTPLRLHADDAEGGGDGAEAVVAAVRALEGKVAAFEAAAATARARSAAAAALEEEEARLRGRVDELEAALAAAVAALAAARNNSEDEEKEKNAGVVEERSQAVDAATRRAEAAEAAATAARESLQVPPAGPCLAIAPFSYTITLAGMQALHARHLGDMQAAAETARSALRRAETADAALAAAKAEAATVGAERASERQVR